MKPMNNPTAVSAVVGQKLSFTSGPGRAAWLAKQLTMPFILAAFGTYLVVGNLVMVVPEGTTFPGPQFFPGIIAAGLFVSAILLAVSGLRETPASATETDDLDGAEDAAERSVRVDLRSFAWVVLPFLGFALSLNVLGWVIGAGLLFVCIARGFGSHKWWANVLAGLTLSSLTYIAFDMLLGLSLPSGVLGWDF